MNTLSLPMLASARVASPCDRRWEDMPGDDRRRYCSDCGLHVHNFAAMTAEEAEAFLRENIPKGRVCGLLYRRADGTVLTRDCPVGVARWRRAAAWSVAKVGTAAACLLGALGLTGAVRQDHRLRAAQPFRAVCEWLNPTPPPPLGFTLPPPGGIRCLPAPIPTPTPAPQPPEAP